jgi:hypothetical protein
MAVPAQTLYLALLLQRAVAMAVVLVLVRLVQMAALVAQAVRQAAFTPKQVVLVHQVKALLEQIQLVLELNQQVCITAVAVAQEPQVL